MPSYPVGITQKPDVTPFFDPGTNTISYVVRDPASKVCAVIDAVMDFDYAAGRIGFKSADKIIQHIRGNGLQLEWLIETHAHADHLSAAPYIQAELGGKIGIGERIREVQEVFGGIFNEGPRFAVTAVSSMLVQGRRHLQDRRPQWRFAMYTPGHTPACMTHVIGDAAFVGDTLFMPDGGTARADFPGGDATNTLPIDQAVLSLPSGMRFSCATIMARTGGKSAGKRPSPKSAQTISMFATASAKTTMSRCARRGIRRSACRS